MNIIKDIFKGIIIGIANIIPGVSGGTLAVSMGIYDKIIHAVNMIFKDFKKSVVILMPYGLGALLGFVLLSFFIENLFIDYPFQAGMIFVGLILGGIPELVNKIDSDKRKINNLLTLLTFLSVTLVTFLFNETDSGLDFKMSALDMILFYGVGLIAALTIVVPGISGSMLLMMMGYYKFLINIINNIFRSIVIFDFTSLVNSLLIIMPFIAGMVTGIFLFAKLIGFMLKKYLSFTYSGIIGLVLSSPFVILKDFKFNNLDEITLVYGIILSLISYLLCQMLSNRK